MRLIRTLILIRQLKKVKLSHQTTRIITLRPSNLVIEYTSLHQFLTTLAATTLSPCTSRLTPAPHLLDICFLQRIQILVFLFSACQQLQPRDADSLLQGLAPSYDVAEALLINHCVVLLYTLVVSGIKGTFVRLFGAHKVIGDFLRNEQVQFGGTRLG